MSDVADVIIEKCRAKWAIVTSLEKEEDAYKEEAKRCRKSIDNLVSEIRRLCVESNQQELALPEEPT